MKNKSLLVIIPLAVWGTGCSSVAEQQPPRPVPVAVRPKPPAPPKKAAKKPAPPVARKQEPTPGNATYAIDDGRSSIKVEPSMPAIQAQPLTPTVETPAALNAPATSVEPGGAVGVVPPVAPAVAAVPAYMVEDVRIPAGTSPAVIALLTEADRNRAAGDLDAAVVSTERALRIDSRNPTLTYKLAQLRIKQNKPQLAEELAGKAALLAGGNLELKRKSWLLIAEARRMQQDYQGAKEAKAKAESF